MRAALIVVVAAALATAALPTAGVAAVSGAGPTVRGLLVTRATLGSGWTVSSPAPRHVPPVACGAQHLRLRGEAAQPAAAATPTWGDGSGGPFVAQTAYLYRGAADALAAWRAEARASLLTCLAQSFTRAAGRTVQFSVTSRRVTSAPHLTTTARAYALQATASGHGQSAPVYLDVLLLFHGTAITELSFSSLITPPPAGLELRVARRAAGLLATA